MTRSRLRRSVTKSDREVMYGLLFVAALLLAAMVLLYTMWS